MIAHDSTNLGGETLGTALKPVLWLCYLGAASHGLSCNVWIVARLGLPAR